MSREIRFRAWDGEAMKPWECINLGHMMSLNSKKWTVMQYTGLHDKNGKEIYEGDVVKQNHLHSDSQVGQVWYRAALGSVVGWMVGAFYMSSMMESIEVIGNVHENPELMSGDSMTAEEVSDG